MGANYDLIIARCPDDAEFAGNLIEFLQAERWKVVHAAPLDSTEVDDRAILFSPSVDGWCEVVALPSALKIGLRDWYDCNPLAAHLSKNAEHAVHLWTLNSGFVAGYASYLQGKKFEADTVFCESALSTEFLMPGVPTPPRQVSIESGRHLGIDIDLSRFLYLHASPEPAIAAVVSRFNFDPHLVEFYEACDERTGVAIIDGRYQAVELKSWNAVVFDGQTTRCNECR